ncbi:putative protein trichome birefringence-like 12 [Iris pallida]|uniref:Trichome birefringence-like N-terminal domain-containing protein n=1 Tax=Iris pallida TaxID=29817 RepID=A0AAX6G2A3_IRIPA|nr:putative protein trichome birefringence-like 12 [Iris pallida]
MGICPRRCTIIPLLLSLSFVLLFLYFLVVPTPPSPKPPSSSASSSSSSSSSSCDLSVGEWSVDPNPPPPLYTATCPFHRNAWNCIKNSRENMARITSLSWRPLSCLLPRIDPELFLRSLRGKRIGFVGDSLNENFVVALLCTLRSADNGARKWKRKGAWRGGYFPSFDVTVAYHRAILLASYTWQPVEQIATPVNDGLKGIYRVDVDVPADDWANVTKFYDVLVFNTGHWWGLDKFPKETPLVFYREGKPITPLGISGGLRVVLQSMISHIEREVPKETIKFWRTQSPRHFYGGEWDHNGSCLFTEPLKQEELDSWFDPRNGGVNKEAREVNHLIQQALKGTSIQLLNLTHLSEFRADAHPAIWLGKKDAVAVWGQDCMHWCLPGLPDTWVDILSARILDRLEVG